MYFDEAPRRTVKDLYNYKDELNTLVEAMESDAKLIVIEGPRRSGKTSLLLTGLHETKHPPGHRRAGVLVSNHYKPQRPDHGP